MARYIPVLISALIVGSLLGACRVEPTEEPLDPDARTEAMRDSLLMAIQADSFLVEIVAAEEDTVVAVPAVRGMYSGSARYETMPGTAETPLSVRVILESMETRPEMETQPTPQTPQGAAAEPDMGPQVEAEALPATFSMEIYWETDSDEIDLQNMSDDTPIDVTHAEAQRRPSVRAEIVEHGRNYSSLDGELRITQIGADRIRGSFVFEIPAGAPPSPPPGTPAATPDAGAATQQQPDMPMQDDQQEMNGQQTLPPARQQPGQVAAGPRLIIGAFDASTGRAIPDPVVDPAPADTLEEIDLNEEEP